MALYDPCGSSSLVWLFEASADHVDTAAQAALTIHQTTEQKESADTTFMAI
jgi:hypothetical protein